MILEESRSGIEYHLSACDLKLLEGLLQASTLVAIRTVNSNLLHGLRRRGDDHPKAIATFRTETVDVFGYGLDAFNSRNFDFKIG